MKKNLPNDSELTLEKTDKKKEASTHRSSRKKSEEVQGRYWGIVLLLFTVLISLVFRFFS